MVQALGYAQHAGCPDMRVARLCLSTGEPVLPYNVPCAESTPNLCPWYLSERTLCGPHNYPERPGSVLMHMCGYNVTHMGVLYVHMWAWPGQAEHLCILCAHTPCTLLPFACKKAGGLESIYTHPL